jgi:hypothetical protein
MEGIVQTSEPRAGSSRRGSAVSASTEAGAFATVSATLQHYAHRGALRDLSETTFESRYEASFIVAGGGRVRLVCNPTEATLAIRDLLPGTPKRSGLAKDLASVLTSCGSPELPPHRHIDPALAELRPLHLRGSAGFELGLRAGNWEWATARAVNLAHETVVMVHAQWPEYAQSQFGAPLE